LRKIKTEAKGATIDPKNIEAAKTIVPVEIITEINDFVKKTDEYMDDDFNTAGAIGTVFQYIPIFNKIMAKDFAEKKNAASLIYETFMRYLGENLLSIASEESLAGDASENANIEGLTEKLVGLLIKIRSDLKAEKNYKMADLVRNGLKEIGVNLEDTKTGTNYHIERKS